MNPTPAGQTPRQNGLPDEITILKTYRHPLVLARALILPLGLALVTAIALLVANAPLDPTTAPALQTAVSLLAGGLAVAVVAFLLWAAYAVWEWLSHTLELTNRRVIIFESKPFRRESHRELPLSKIQNITSSLDSPLNKSLDYGRLVIDMSGQRSETFTEVPHPDALRQAILAAQRALQSATADPRAQYRQAVARSIIYHTPAPPPPVGIYAIKPPEARKGFGFFNSLFPFNPQVEGLNITWHRHWWFLLKSELLPIFIVVTYELTALIVSALFAPPNPDPISPILAVLRPIIWIIALLAALYFWDDWRNDYYAVRNDQLIDHDALPFGLFEETKETDLRRVTDLRFDKPSVVAYLLRYGNVVIYTPGGQTSFTFDGVAHPAEVLREITNRIEALRERDQFQTSQEMQDLLRAYSDEDSRQRRWQAYQQRRRP